MTEAQSKAAKRRWQNPGRTWQESFWDKVVKSEGCWLWIGGKDANGYGCFAYPKPSQRQDRAHRIAYELLIGPIPDGLTIDHLCRNPPCVNPAHLEPVTIGENLRRWRAVTNPPTCPKGHPFTPENIYDKPNPGRRCKQCACERAREYRRQGRDKAAMAKWTPEQLEERRHKQREYRRRQRTNT